jgi:hypothetical protein
MGHEQRKRVWVDHFQTQLAWRIGLYLALFLAVLINFLFVWKLLSEGVHNPVEQLLSMLRDYLPVGICLLALVPVMAWDAIRFSHRLLGPVVRFRQTVQSIARGEAVRPIKLREGDYLTEFRDEFNQMLIALQRQGASVLKPDVPAPDDKTQSQSA